jgi:lactate 2-monooxygenase
MSEPQNKDGSNGEEKVPYGQYRFDLYARAMITGQKPIVTTDPNKLEQAAREAMAPEAFNYVFGGAGEQATMHANRLAFRQWKLIPRMLRPTMPRDLSVELFGKKYGEYIPNKTVHQTTFTAQSSSYTGYILTIPRQTPPS